MIQWWLRWRWDDSVALVCWTAYDNLTDAGSGGIGSRRSAGVTRLMERWRSLGDRTAVDVRTYGIMHGGIMMLFWRNVGKHLQKRAMRISLNGKFNVQYLQVP